VRIFSRVDELESLRKRLAERRSTLVHGPSGVGKTLLLDHLIPEFSHVLYCPAPSSPLALFRRLAQLLAARRDPTVLRICGARPGALLGKSAISLKGIVSDALRAGTYLIVLDHLNRPSSAMASAIAEIMLSCSTPVVAVARSAHMEDAGYVLPLLPDRSERLAIRNFDSETARAFAVEVSSRQQLEAANLSGILANIIRCAQGNPGAILRMVAMARLPKYRLDGHIKWSPLYIDFLMEWVAAQAV